MSGRSQDEQERWVLRRRLVERGIALDPVPETPQTSWPISVVFDPNPMSSVLYPIWNDCAIACCIWVEFVAIRPVPYIDEVCLSLPKPFGDMPFEWWRDPRETTHQMYYEFPGGRNIPRGNVVNHQLQRGLPSGKPLQGYLLGVSHQRFPSEVCSPIAARLVLFDAASDMLACQAVSLNVPACREKNLPTLKRPSSLFDLEDESEIDYKSKPGSRKVH